jgi:hypothetical protein
VALYRDMNVNQVPLTAIGEGLVVSISNGTPIMLIVSSRDAVQSGDYVVPRR